MDKYIQNTDFNLVTTHQILHHIGLIDSFKGKWNSMEAGESRYLKEWSGIAIIESTGSSARLDGHSLTNSDIQELINSGSKSMSKSEGAKDAMGYFEALQIVQEHYSRISISGSYIKKLHQLVLKRCV